MKPVETGPGPAHECTYIAGVLRVVNLVPAHQTSHLRIAHDDWCPVIGGDGHRACQPVFVLNGVRVAFPAAKMEP